MKLLRTIAGLAVIAAGLCGGPTISSAQTLPTADGPQVVLYELTENMKITGGKMVRRLATAALGGFAVEGSPICPAGVGTDGFCNVNVEGSDNISTRTGVGSLNGSFAITAQDTNPFDAPEVVVLRGTFRGSIDLSPALLRDIPIGTMTGSMVLARGGRSVPIRGVFRLPFDGRACGFTGPAYLTSGVDGVPTGCVPVQPSEMLFGSAMVRLDIWFE